MLHKVNVSKSLSKPSSGSC